MDSSLKEKDWLLINTFSFFDREKSGSLSQNGLQLAFKCLGIKIEYDEIATMMNELLIEIHGTEIQSTNNNKITFDDFKNIMEDKIYEPLDQIKNNNEETKIEITDQNINE